MKTLAILGEIDLSGVCRLYFFVCRPLLSDNRGPMTSTIYFGVRRETGDR